MKFAVLGDPIEHSKSPAIHNAAYRALNLDWEYDRHRVNASELAAFLDQHLGDYQGFSLTMPLKEELFRIAGERGWQVDATSEALGCSNTLYRIGDSFGVANTDVLGARHALNHLADSVESVAILGSGATARSVSVAIATSFAKLAEITVFSRRSEPAEAIFELISSISPGIKCSWLPLEAAADFGGSDLTVNTIPASAGVELEIDRKFGQSWIFDVTYSPWPTQLASEWPAENRVSGLEMLVQQAIEQLGLFGAVQQELAPTDREKLATAMSSAAE